MPEKDEGGRSTDGQGIVAPRYPDKLAHELIENSLGLICSHDLEGRLLTVNQAVADALGYTCEEIENRNLREFIDPAVTNRFDGYLARIRREGSARGYLKLVTRTGDRVIWVFQNRLHEETGLPPVVLGHAQDITWRLAIEQRLRDTNENYRQLFEDAPVAYHEIDRKGIIIKLNRAECDLLGFEKDEVLGRPVWELVVPEHQAESKESVLRKLGGEQQLVPFFREYIRHDGKRLVLNIHENLIRSITGEILGIRSTLLDVTDQHNIELELRRLNTELDKRVADRTAEVSASHERMREFVYTVSHDLQEPLRSIGSFARLLTERYSDRLDSDGTEFLQYVVSGAARMSALIKDLLSYSRVLHDESDYFELVSLQQTVATVVEILRRTIEQVGATITVGDLPVVKGNPHRLVQLFQNLVSNAIKYRREQPPQIRIDARRNESHWILSVTDNGVGVEDGDRERIFGLFKRSQRGIAAGSGVGLAICQAIVERHGGRIWIEPAPDGGSIFAFTLPDASSYVMK